MPFEISPAIASYLQVTLINLVLSGDNIVVIGISAANLPPVLRRKAIMAGVIAAAVIRIIFAVIAVQLLAFGRRPAAFLGLLDHVAGTAFRRSQRIRAG